MFGNFFFFGLAEGNGGLGAEPPQHSAKTFSKDSIADCLKCDEVVVACTSLT